MLPLAGVKVIEFCQVLAGPFCGCLLADMGADVIKVEPPEGGDLMRQWPPLLDGYSQYFASVNRNKRSVILNLKDDSERDAARKLVLSADVVIENFRPGVMARFGLDHATLAKAKPELVYCSVSAFGQSGPRAADGGFDMTVQAMSGVMSVTGEPDGRPAKCGIPIADFTAGLYAAFSIAAALYKRSSSGTMPRRCSVLSPRAASRVRRSIATPRCSPTRRFNTWAGSKISRFPAAPPPGP